MTKHTLFCADSRYLNDFIDRQSVDLVVTSPPYFLEKKYEKGVCFDDHLEMIEDVMRECRNVLRTGRMIVWNVAHSPQKNVPMWHSMLLEKYFTFVDDIIWKKETKNSPRFGNFILTGRYYPNNSWEHVYVFSKGKANVVVDNKDFRNMMKYRNDVWNIHPRRSDDHPAIFPEELVEMVLRFYSNVGDVVLDPFGGSGTTMKVSRDLGRSSFCVEKDMEYCKSAMKRVGFGQTTLFEDILYRFRAVEKKR